MKKMTTKKLVMTSLFMAFTIIATMFIRIPITFGYVNLGDAFIFLSVFILGPLCGVVVGGVGAGLADLFGFAAYAPGTLVIKALMAVGVVVSVSAMRVLYATKILEKFDFYKS